MSTLSAADVVARGSLQLPDKVTFNAHIRPIMSKACFLCHGPDEEDNDSGFRLDSFEHATGAIPSDQTRVGLHPGDPMKSEIYLRITGQSDAGPQMPPDEFRHSLTARDKELFRLWIEQGAEYEQHWSYAPISRAVHPAPADAAHWIVNPIDAFILARLQQTGLQPSPPADRATLLRRVTLDLIGLPPTVQEVNDFVNDKSGQAYERVIDRLLRSPHFGERMASFWLDLVRYADTVGFHGDQNQRIFPYRDYVIHAFNSDMPFDQFTREQLAGDLLPNPTTDQLVATGFLRLNMMTREGGAQPGEYLAKYRADRVRALGTAWLGSTLGCCECHNHKYDPFTTRDFYSFGAFFDDLRQWGVYSDYGYTPNSDLKGFTNDHPFPPEIRLDSPSLRAEIAKQERARDAELLAEFGPETLDTPQFAKWVATLQQYLTRWPHGWEPLAINQVAASKQSSNQVLDDGSVLFSGPPQPDEKISFDATVASSMAINSVRVEVLPHQRNGGHVGRSSDGRFTVASFTATVDRVAKSPPTVVANRPRFVRLELPGPSRILSVAEVEVFVSTKDGESVNVAPEGRARQSSDHNNDLAGLAIDGNTDGDLPKAASTSHTLTEHDPWWELDLGVERRIEKIRIWNRTDGNLGSRMKGVQLVLLDDARRRMHVSALATPNPSLEVKVPDQVKLPSQQQIGFEWAQADRCDPYSYQNGHEPASLKKGWRSGPAQWQLPSNEAELPHTAIYHFDRPLVLPPEATLRLTMVSSDVGCVRFSVTPLADAIPGFDAADEQLRRAAQTTSDRRTEHQTASLVSAFHRSTIAQSQGSDTSREYRDRILELRAGKAMSLVAQGLPETQIPLSRVLPRGDWQNTSGELAPPSFPKFLQVGPYSDSASIPETRLTRLDLANWLTSPANPLTARHLVNRTWKQFFGTGLSGKLDDLGSQGEWPSHPKLLDWLANELVRNEWHLKQLVKLIVTSNTYRQSAAVRNDLADLDPYNRLLAQQSARRLEAEIIRDNALSISGLLVTDYIGGPSVFPYQPDGHYRNLQFPSRRYRASDGWRQYRRGVYMHWQRTFLHPMLVNFDAPSRDECTADRQLSNSPQQALTLLNDPTFVEASSALAHGLLRTVGDDFAQLLDQAFMQALARKPTPLEFDALSELYTNQLAHYRANPQQARQLLQTRGATASDEFPSDQLAALAQVCRVVLNLHETITRY